MEPFHQYIDEYRKQLKKGAIKKAYKGLVGYINELRLHLKNKYPDHFVSGSVQEYDLDFTYFYFFPMALKRKNLKVMIFFDHGEFAFKIWLAGYNKKTQSEYLNLITERKWTKYNRAQASQDVDYIIEHSLICKPDFSDLDCLTKHLEKEILNFLENVEGFLSTL